MGLILQVISIRVVNTPQGNRDLSRERSLGKLPNLPFWARFTPNHCHSAVARAHRVDTHGSCCCYSCDPREHEAALPTGSRGRREKEAVWRPCTVKPRYGKVKTPSPGCHPQEDVFTRIEGEESLPMPEGRVFPVWRGIGASSGIGWSQGWARCLKWDPNRTDLAVFREDGIISGYRHPRSSALDCILSSFQMNNETINIWTHFLPTWYFLWRFCVLCSTLNFLTDSYTWPLLVYMMLICVYPFTSSCAHTFSTMSAESRHICYFFDYGALSLYSLGCAISYGYYVMPECWVNTWLHQHFVPIAIGNTVFCTSLSCYSRFLELQCPKRSKALRTIAFVVPFIFDTVPLIYRVSHVKGDRKVK
ncbi:membrane progestin receptor delta [Neolamprologus brichardi]|uniref:membrane progestin receptor delta n=1 Tax=Neolamprologus brichardi TaxID=32507 RepID=UPI001643B334|nr:membrane progestin receptor delta [Neolamprologus brichardi]